MLQTISTAFHRGGWGMWPILFTSIVMIAIIVERAVFLFKASVDKDKLLALLKSQVMAGNVQGAIKVCSGNPTPLTRIIQSGLTKFNRPDHEVQAAMDEGKTDQLVFFVFDLLFLDGKSTAQLPLIERKERLQRLFKKETHGVRFSEHVAGDGPRFRAQACKLGLEGAISKQGVLGDGVLLLEKPFTADKLARAVREALDRPAPLA